MPYIQLAECPALRSLVTMEYCRACEQHVDGVGCPSLSRVVPREHCLAGCPHADGDMCTKGGKTGTELVPKVDVWDSEVALCAYPRQIGMTRMRVEEG